MLRHSDNVEVIISKALLVAKEDSYANTSIVTSRNALLIMLLNRYRRNKKNNNRQYNNDNVKRDGLNAVAVSLLRVIPSAVMMRMIIVSNKMITIRSVDRNRYR